MRWCRRVLVGFVAEEEGAARTVQIGVALGKLCAEVLAGGYPVQVRGKRALRPGQGHRGDRAGDQLMDINPLAIDRLRQWLPPWRWRCRSISLSRIRSNWRRMRKPIVKPDELPGAAPRRSREREIVNPQE
jgi:hypothetical protein